jgi:hypothetical protein
MRSTTAVILQRRLAKGIYMDIYRNSMASLTSKLHSAAKLKKSRGSRHRFSDDTIKFLCEETGNTKNLLLKSLNQKKIESASFTEAEVESIKLVCSHFQVPLSVLAENPKAFVLNDSETLHEKCEYLLIRLSSGDFNHFGKLITGAPFLLEKSLAELKELFDLIENEFEFPRSFIQESVADPAFRLFYAESPANLRFFANLLLKEYELSTDCLQKLLLNCPTILQPSLMDGFVERKSIFENHFKWDTSSPVFETMVVRYPRLLWIPPEKLARFLFVFGQLQQQLFSISETLSNEKVSMFFARHKEILSYSWLLLDRLVDRSKGILFYLTNDPKVLTIIDELKLSFDQSSSNNKNNKMNKLFSSLEKQEILRKQRELHDRFLEEGDKKNDPLELEATLLLRMNSRGTGIGGGNEDSSSLGRTYRKSSDLRTSLAEEYEDFIAFKTGKEENHGKYEELVKRLIESNLILLNKSQEFDRAAFRSLENDLKSTKKYSLVDFYRELWKPSEGMFINRSKAVDVLFSADFLLSRGSSVMEKFGLFSVALGMNELEITRFAASFAR